MVRWGTMGARWSRVVCLFFGGGGTVGVRACAAALQAVLWPWMAYVPSV